MNILIKAGIGALGFGLGFLAKGLVVGRKAKKVAPEAVPAQ